MLRYVSRTVAEQTRQMASTSAATAGRATTPGRSAVVAEAPVEQPRGGGELVAVHVQEHADDGASAAPRRDGEAVAGGGRRSGLDADRARVRPQEPVAVHVHRRPGLVCAFADQR